MVENFLMKNYYYQYVYKVLYYNLFEYHEHLIYVSRKKKHFKVLGQFVAGQIVRSPRSFDPTPTGNSLESLHRLHQNGMKLSELVPVVIAVGSKKI